MIKYFLICSILFNAQIFSQSIKELEDFVVAETLLDLKECDNSISSFKELLTKYPDSKKIEDYYYFLDKALECKKNSNNQVSSDSKKKIQSLHGKGTVTITFYNTNRIITNVDSQRISVDEKYLTKFSNGKHKEYFENILLWLYPRKDSKFLELIQNLQNSDNYNLKYYSNLFLATYLFSEKNFRKAIGIYSNLIKICKKDGDKSIYQLYLSNCYYNLGEYDKAIEELKKVYIIEKDFKKKYMSKMADRWMPFYLEMAKNPANTRKQLLFIN